MTLTVTHRLTDPFQAVLTQTYRNDYFWYYNNLTVTIGPVQEYSWGPVSVRAISYIESKNSINLPLPLSAEVQITESFRLSSPKLLKRKPKRPLYKPKKYRKLKLPELKLVDRSIYEIKSPVKVTEGSRKRFLRAFYRREKIIATTNRQRQARYDRSLALSIRVMKTRLENRMKYDAAYKVRLAKYEHRLKLWTKSVASLKARIVTAERKRLARTTDHPFHMARFVNNDPMGVTRRPYSWRQSQAWIDSLSPNMWWSGGYAVYELYPVNLSSLSDVQKTSLANDIVEAHHNVLRSLADTYDPILVPRLFNKLAQSKVDVGNLLAERSQTISLFTDTVKLLAKLISGKKKLLRTLAQTGASPRKLSDEYLKFQFGVKPLLSDYETLLASLTSQSESLDIKVRAVQKRIPVSVVHQGVAISGILEIRYVLRFTTENALFHKLQEWGFVNPLSIGWEMTPWSFVVDWFYPIGDIIQAQTAKIGLSFVSGTRSIAFTGTMSSSSTTVLQLIGTETASPLPTIADGSWSVKTKIRDVLKAPPEFELPTIKNPFSWTHGFESLALLIQKIK